jgi:hypothetical protein
MKNIGLISLAGLASCVVSSALFAATQSIVASPRSFNASAEETLELSLLYPEGNPETTGVGVQIFFDSTKLEFVGSKGLLESTFTHISPVSTDDTNLDSSDETDSKVVTSFGVPSGIFIASGDMPSSLLTITFKAKGSFDSATVINFSGTPGAGHEVAFAPVEISYKDNVAPVVTAPASLTVDATGETTSVNLGTATAIDAVEGDLVATANNNGPFTLGIHTITWEASDSSGNTAVAQQMVTVVDNIAPVVTAPASLTVEATGETTAVNLGTAIATDTVEGDLVAIANNTGPFALGTHTITWEASDSSGNTSVAQQIVTVVDNVAPVVTAPASLTVEATGDTTVVDLGTATAIDVVDGDLVTTTNDTGPFAVGIHSITWTATDNSGNSATAEQTVTVNEAVVTTTKKSGGGSVPLFFLPLLLVFGLVGRKLDSATKGDLKDA